jgi:hypothetical protein
MSGPIDIFGIGNLPLIVRQIILAVIIALMGALACGALWLIWKLFVWLVQLAS